MRSCGSGPSFFMSVLRYLFMPNLPFVGSMCWLIMWVVLICGGYTGYRVLRDSKYDIAAQWNKGLTVFTCYKAGMNVSRVPEEGTENDIGATMTYSTSACQLDFGWSNPWVEVGSLLASEMTPSRVRYETYAEGASNDSLF